MMVPFCKSVDIESEVNLCVEDITNALYESLSNAKIADHSNAINIFVSEVHQCLRSIDDQMILKLPEKHRQIIAKALHDHAIRFWPEEAKS